MGNNKFSYGHIRFYLKIKALTGLRIGGGKETIEIGATDNPVVKDIRGFPYIPGSSLKGKLRSLTEKINGIFGTFDLKGSSEEEIIKNFEESIKRRNIENSEPFGISLKNIRLGEREKIYNYILDKIVRDEDLFIIRMFGNHKGDIGIEPRIIVRDLILDTKETIKNLNVKEEELKDKIYELKQENVINRIEGKAEHPREIERVVSGVVFKGEIIYKLLGWTHLSKEEVINQAKKEIEELKKVIIYLTKYDYLGGSGTRGYGKIAVYIDKIEFKVEDSQGVVIMGEKGPEVEGTYDVSIEELIKVLKEFYKEINEVAKIEEENYK